ncbi:glycosyltransferase family 2 protein [Spirosoma agri]|uniref:Glycosyltransferase n=1 Tax=Spirosoma agri TaxID=1987381 RepID=A0A6M0IKR6_9BACT|nr:glycosyltransferase family 2 protein [Spirosoma agri]NEU68860.1 glycosyltransferase [Spirosoma agri]
MKLIKATPLISIITVVYNSASTLETTILSVLNQKQDLIDYWIIDGGSTDGSIDIIKRYEHMLSGWISEPDKGIYDAMNKGIDRVNGKWIYFLGADDVLNLKVLEQISPYLKTEYSLVFGQVVFDNNYQMNSYLGKRTLFQNTVHHQSAFYNKSVFSEFRYDSSLKILADYELNLLLYIRKSLTLFVPLVIATCATGGASSEFSRSLKETNIVRNRNIKSQVKGKFLSIILSLYYFQKKMRYYIYGHQV